MKTEQPIMSSNRFAPVTNLKENLTDQTRPTCNSGHRKTHKKFTNEASAGNKIPTIINGRVMNDETHNKEVQ